LFEQSALTLTDVQLLLAYLNNGFEISFEGNGTDYYALASLGGQLLGSACGITWDNSFTDLGVDNAAQSQGGGGIEPSITAGLAVIGGMVGSLEESYKYGSHNVRRAQRINGKVRHPSVLTSANQINATKMVSGLKFVGKGVTVLSIAANGYNFFTSDFSGNDWARLGGAVLITATAFIPVVVPFISIGLVAADSYGAFDNIYNYFE